VRLIDASKALRECQVLRVTHTDGTLYVEDVIGGREKVLQLLNVVVEIIVLLTVVDTEAGNKQQF